MKVKRKMQFIPNLQSGGEGEAANFGENVPSELSL